MAQPLAQEKAPTAISFQGPTLIPIVPSTAASVEDHLHELRVRIPVDLHRQLLSLKVLRGKSLAETVSTALDIYFEEHAKRAHDAAE